MPKYAASVAAEHSAFKLALMALCPLQAPFFAAVAAAAGMTRWAEDSELPSLEPAKLPNLDRYFRTGTCRDLARRPVICCFLPMAGFNAFSSRHTPLSHREDASRKVPWLRAIRQIYTESPHLCGAESTVPFG